MECASINSLGPTPASVIAAEVPALWRRWVDGQVPVAFWMSLQATPAFLNLRFERILARFALPSPEAN